MLTEMESAPLALILLRNTFKEYTKYRDVVNENLNQNLKSVFCNPPPPKKTTAKGEKGVSRSWDQNNGILVIIHEF